jgi:undecaprenyl-diphosphatase
MDARMFRAVNRFADRTTWAHDTVRTYATSGIALYAVLLLVGWWQARQDDDLGGVASVVSAGAAALAALGLAQVVGHVVGRARAATAMPATPLLVARTADFSFPSDHATAVGAVAVGLLLARRSLGLVACVAAVAMAFARVYVGAHYPGDVVAGLALGGVTAVLVRAIAARPLVWVLERVRASPAGPLVARRAER